VKFVNKAREKILLVKIQKYQDKESFTELYQALIDPLYRFIFFKVNDAELAQDLVAEVFLRGWREMTGEKATRVKHLKAFFYTIARHLVIDYYRSTARQKEVQLLENEGPAVAISSSEPLHEVEVKIESEQILKLVNLLKASYQEIIILRHIEELSLTEISRIIQKSPVATRVLLHRANKALKREYDKITGSN